MILRGFDNLIAEGYTDFIGGHLFTWGNASCLEDDEARKAFDRLSYTEAIKFYGGYSNHIEEVLSRGLLKIREEISLCYWQKAWVFLRNIYYGEEKI